MRLFPVSITVFALLAGCQTTPNSGDTSNATLRFRIHYQSAKIGTPNVEVVTTTSIEAGQCVYVASPFGVAANAADSGGIRSIVLGPSGLFDAVKVRQLAGDTVALPSPAESTQLWSGNTISNPGTPPGSAMVMVEYSKAKAFDTVNLLGTYEFAGGSKLGALRGTVRNFGATTGVSEVYNFYVRPATNAAAEQPGMPCKLP
jgi:hypothetical protein